MTYTHNPAKENFPKVQINLLPKKQGLRFLPYLLAYGLACHSFVATKQKGMRFLDQSKTRFITRL